MLSPLFLFGLGPLEIAIIIALVALLFGAPLVKRLGHRVGEVAGASEQAVEEFEAGREGG